MRRERVTKIAGHERHARVARVRRRAASFCLMLALASSIVLAQEQSQSSQSSRDGANAARQYPREIRGYRIERADVRVRRQRNQQRSRDERGSAASSSSSSPSTSNTNTQQTQQSSEPELITLGAPRLVHMTPLAITLEVPVTVAPVEQGGTVDLLVFEDMTVNGTPVTVEDYRHPFRLPNERPARLPDPIRIEISMARALIGALGEWNSESATWPVTGRVYVCGRFRRFLINFKRAVPVELNLRVPNPLRNSSAPAPN